MPTSCLPYTTANRDLLIWRKKYHKSCQSWMNDFFAQAIWTIFGCFWCFNCYFSSKLFFTQWVIHDKIASDVRINFMSRTFHFKISHKLRFAMTQWDNFDSYTWTHVLSIQTPDCFCSHLAFSTLTDITDVLTTRAASSRPYLSTLPVAQSF